MRFADDVHLGRAEHGRAEFGTSGIVVVVVRDGGGGGRVERPRSRQRGRLADRATAGGRRVVEVERRGGGGDRGYGQQHHRRVLPRPLHVHGGHADPTASRRRGRRRRWLTGASAVTAPAATAVAISAAAAAAAAAAVAAPASTAVPAVGHTAADGIETPAADDRPEVMAAVAPEEEPRTLPGVGDRSADDREHGPSDG